MKNLHFDYSFIINYEQDVGRCYYTIKAIPQDSARQKIQNLEIEMIPESKPEWGTDCHGNKYIWGCNPLPHKMFKFRVTGKAVCGLKDYEEVVEENELMIFRHHTKITVPGTVLSEYFKKCSQELNLSTISSELEKATLLMEKLNADFSYEKNVTDVKTTAEEAFIKGKGVCQDFAHIYISLLIMAGCSARYVTGFITGEGATHAWVEVACNGKWYGIDPCNKTNNMESYIKIGVGRDASECLVNRGVMHGGGNQTLETFVNVTDIGHGSDLLKKGFV